MDGLVHDNPAAIELPGTPPASPVVVFLRAIFLVNGFPQHQLAQQPHFDSLLGLEDILTEPQRIMHRQFHPVPCTLLYHLVCFGQADLHRLFDQHVFARPGSRHRYLPMQATGS